MKKTLVFFLLCLFGAKYDNAQIVYPGKAPGPAAGHTGGSRLQLENNQLRVVWKIGGHTLHTEVFEDRVAHEKMTFAEIPLFTIVLKNGSVIPSTRFMLEEKPASLRIRGQQAAVKYAERLNGRAFSARLVDTTEQISVQWKAVLKDGSNYIQQFFHFQALKDSVKIDRVVLFHFPATEGMRKEGVVDGSPIVYKNMFFAIEHPMSQVTSSGPGLLGYLSRQEALRPGRPFSISDVMGATPAGQLRRGFLYYVERERAVPYRQFLHYNSWYDLSWVDRKLNDSACLDRIQTFADSLIIKRQVPMKAFLFDDGWDDNRTLWQFDSGFPDGFSHLAARAAKYHAQLGVWISPWGGYDKAKAQRLQYGRLQNPPFETNEHGFSLSGPVYYHRFREVAERFIKKYHVAIFKFDGVGAGDLAPGAGITYQKDIESLLRLVGALRSIKPDQYFSLTIGTWPSVYWLQYGDNIWREGSDTWTDGPGTTRQQWITYRDEQVYKNIVKRAPLYPLNALMYHGVCIAPHGVPAKFDLDEKDIADEIWSFFGNGTSLQELYVDPHMLSSKEWDCLAKAIRWSGKNARVMPDVHWVGGDPSRGELYGFAAWSPGKGVLTLRNPSTETKSIPINVADVFQLPAAFSKEGYRFYNERTGSRQPVASGKSFSLTLKPFEVLVLNALPGPGK